MRLNKLIATSGIASRREAERIILDGRVKVNGLIVDNVVSFVFDGDEIIVDGSNISQWLQKDFAMNQTSLWLFHKPRGVITSRSDPQGRTTLFSLLPKNLQNLVSVGRLDYNTEGLILLTNNGSFARYFELPKNAIERVYCCRVFGGELSKRDLDEIRYGVEIETMQYDPIKIVKNSNKQYTLTLSEGKNREIRRIFEHYGLKVIRLLRIAYGEFKLSNLEPREVLQVSSEVVQKYKIKL